MMSHTRLRAGVIAGLSAAVMALAPSPARAATAAARAPRGAAAPDSTLLALFGSDVVPLHYAVQATWYMDLLELDECDFPVLIWPHDMRDLLGLTPAEIVAECEPITLKFAYSPSLARLMRERVDAFWHEHVKGETPPPAVELEDIKRLVWVARGKTIPADEKLIATLLRRDKLKAAADKLDALVKQNEFELRQQFGDAEAAIHPKTKQPLVTMKATERAAYVANVKATSFRTIRTTKQWKEMQQ